jgi:cardiolipin synthase
MSAGRDVANLNLSGISQGNPLLAAPNLLTMVRIVLTPLLVAAVYQRRFALAFGLFVVAAITDAMDGTLARLLRQRTRLGQYLDPIADKILLSSLFLILTWMGILEPRIAAVVFGRDIGMLLVAWILYNTTTLRDFHPTFLGKANSFSQVLCIGFVLLCQMPDPAWVQPWVSEGRTISLNVTIILTVASGFHYALVASRRLDLAGNHDTKA